jgi:UDP-4-amino-4,6-dideoxy-N-acetyl-beta-L-altrosamine N-acetyltransferase
MRELRKNFIFGDIRLLNFTRLNAGNKRLILRWRNNKNIRRWMYCNRLIAIKEHGDFISRLKNDCRNFYWLVKNKKGDGIGVIYLNRLDLLNKNAYLGIYANPQANIKGSGTILMDCLRRIAFKILKLHTLKLEVIEGNQRALRFYRNVGFRKEGTLKSMVRQGKRWHDVIIMGL